MEQKPSDRDKHSARLISAGRALVVFVGCVTVFIAVGPLLGGVAFILLTAGSADVVNRLGLALIFLFGLAPASLAGLCYAGALVGLLYSRTGAAYVTSEGAHLRLGWGLGAVCGAAPSFLLGAVGGGSMLPLAIVAAFAGAFCGRLCSAWVIRFERAAPSAVLAALLAVALVVYLPHLLSAQIEEMLRRIAEPRVSTGTTELLTYQKRQVLQRCGGDRLEADAPACDEFVTEGGATVWSVPKAFLRGDGTAGFILDGALPDPLSPGSSSQLTIHVTNRRNGDYFWAEAAAGRNFGFKPVDLLSERTEGLLHFRARKSGHCTRRDRILAVPAQAEAYKALLAQSQEPYVCWPTGDEYFVSPPGAVPPRISIHCPVPALDGGGATCQVQTEFRGWLIEYSVPGAQRHRWKAYDSVVKPFLETLVKEECDEPLWIPSNVPVPRSALRGCRAP